MGNLEKSRKAQAREIEASTSKVRL